MIKYIITAALLLILINNGDVAKTSYVLTHTSNGQKTETDKQKAPDFTLYGVDGKEVKLSDYTGKIVILDFWATWCPPCREGIPDLVSIQSEYKDDVVVIGISLDDTKTQKDVLPFVKSLGVNYPVVLGTMDVVNAYGNIYAIPTSFLIDKSGNIVNTHVGIVPKENIKSEIDSLLRKM